MTLSGFSICQRILKIQSFFRLTLKVQIYYKKLSAQHLQCASIYTINSHSELVSESVTKFLTMKRLIFILTIMATLLFVANTESYAQDVRNSSYSTIAHIDSDGTVRNSSYSTIGHIDSDGTVRNSSYSTIGHIDKDGTVRNSSYSTIGHIDKDGTVRNSSYSTIGHIDSDGTVRNSSYSTIGHAKGIKREWAAVFFFFNFF